MKKQIYQTFIAIRKILKFKDKNRNNKKNPVSSPILSLAPKVLTEPEDLQRIEPYLNNLKQAIDAPDINNIAITGSYGSGKSTILKTFREINTVNYKFLNISLASFSEKKDIDAIDDPDFERRVEISVLQQIFYHVKPCEIPDSRFKRIITLTSRKLSAVSFLITLWLFGLMVFINFKYFNKIDPHFWDIRHKLDFAAFFTTLIVLIGIIILVKKAIRLFKNSKVHKLTIKGELEIGDSIDKSIFNKHIEELLYFFEATKFNVVVIEDVDRVQSTEIFTKLREINILLNNSTLIKEPVKFIYAIKDDVFKDKSDRVKFFEFIIPIIPFVNPSNASEQLTKLIVNAGLQDVLSEDFINNIVTFIDDIDMRLLINIFHEFQIYRSLISGLKQENLFSIIIYKNLYPDDFECLHKRKGKLFEFFENKYKLIEHINYKSGLRVEEIDSELIKLESEFVRHKNELRAIYIHRIVAKLPLFHGFKLSTGEKGIWDALSDDNFNEISKCTKIPFFTMVNNRYDVDFSIRATESNFGFKEIEMEVAPDKTYQQREKLLQEIENKNVKSLNLEKEQLKAKMIDASLLGFKDLIVMVDDDSFLGEFQNDRLVSTLLIMGYIDENYENYISLFHNISLTQEDFTFERRVKLKVGQKLPFDYKLTKIGNLINRIPQEHFSSFDILNFDLLTHLISNKDAEKRKYSIFYQVLCKDADIQFDFINGYIKNCRPNELRTFISDLCLYNKNLWNQLIGRQKHSKYEVSDILIHIFNYASLEAIMNFEAIEVLDSYLSDMGDFFDFASGLDQSNTLFNYCRNRQIQIELLDMPNSDQKVLFQNMYANNLYQLNQHNIEIVLANNGIQFESEKLKAATYSTIKAAKLQKLDEYIKSQIEYFVENVLLTVDNTNEGEAELLELLNNEHISLAVKEKLISKQSVKIQSLEDVEDKEIMSMLLKTVKVEPTWENVFNYYSEHDTSEIDDVLFEFLQKEEVYGVLSEESIDEQFIKNESASDFFEQFIYLDKLNFKAYKALLRRVPYEYGELDFNKLSSSMVESLIMNNLVSFTSRNFSEIKAKHSNLHIRLIANNSIIFIDDSSEFSLDGDDWELLLKSEEVSIDGKRNLIEIMNSDFIIENQKIAEQVLKIMPEDSTLEFGYNEIKSLLAVKSPISKKVKLLVNYNEIFDHTNLQVLVSYLDSEYARIFTKQKKPTFPNTDYNQKLFNILKTRNMISSYSIDDKKDLIRVVAKY